MKVQVVENPRKRRRGHKGYTEKQLAAGFGGRSRMSTTRRHRRRNPALATLSGVAGNPRRRHRRRRSLGAYRSYRRHRNPFLGLPGIDLMSVVYVTAGVIGSKAVPNMLITKIWPGMPTSGLTYQAVRAGSVLALGYGINKILKAPKAGNLIMVGGLAAIFYDLFQEYVAPKIGLAGLGYNGGFVSPADMERVLSGTGGFVHTPTSNIAGFVDQPAEIMAA